MSWCWQPLAAWPEAVSGGGGHSDGLRSPQVWGGFREGEGDPHTGTAGGAAGRTPTLTRRHRPGLAPVLNAWPLGASASRLAEGVVGQAGSEVPGWACDAPPTVVGEGRA